MEVFNGQVTIELPEGYEPWDIKEPGAGEDSGPLISLLSNGSDPDTASLPVPSPGLSFRSIRNKNTRILGVETPEDWHSEKLEERLNMYSALLARSLPLFENYDMTYKQLNKNGAYIGQIRYAFATPEQDWYSSLLIFPVNGKEALINMVCTAEDADQAMVDFLSISNSITVCG